MSLSGNREYFDGDKYTIFRFTNGEPVLTYSSGNSDYMENVKFFELNEANEVWLRGFKTNGNGEFNWYKLIPTPSDKKSTMDYSWDIKTQADVPKALQMQLLLGAM